MKILHIISQRPDSTGSGIYLQAILRESFRAGHENFLLAGLQDSNMADLPGIENKNCSFIHFNSENKHNAIVGMSDVMPYPSRTFRDMDNQAINRYLEMFREPLKTMVDIIKPDILHTHHLWLLSSLVRHLFPQLPLVSSCHGSDLRQFEQCAHLRKRVLSGCRSIDSILALSSEQKEQIAQTYAIPKEKITITGAGYNNSLFFDNNRGVRSNNILYAGKISRAKGVNWLLDALTGMPLNSFHLHLVGGGTGNEYEACIEKAKLLGDKVSIHGLVSQDRLAELMRSSHLLILPSLHEGLPLVVLEALGCGCRVIATDLPGTREIHKQIKSRDLILIKTPKVTNMDETLLDNEEHFINDLRTAIRNTFASTSSFSSGSGLEYFTWQNVFHRVENNWFSTYKGFTKITV